MNNIELTAPKSWAELTEQQVIFVAELFSQGNISEVEFKLRCLFEFTGLQPYVVPSYLFRKAEKMKTQVPHLYKFNGKKYEIDDDTIFQFAENFKFLLEAPGVMQCPRNIAGLLRNDNTLWHTTFEEYLMADRYYVAYSKTKREDFLCGMIAILWRKKGKPYRDNLIEKNTVKIRKHSQEKERQAVFLWWTGIKVWLRLRYYNLFSKQTSNTIEIGAAAEEDESTMIMNMLYAITEGKAHENEKVYKTPVHEVLFALNQKAKNINEINSKLKK